MAANRLTDKQYRSIIKSAKHLYSMYLGAAAETAGMVYEANKEGGLEEAKEVINDILDEYGFTTPSEVKRFFRQDIDDKLRGQMSELIPLTLGAKKTGEGLKSGNSVVGFYKKLNKISL